MRDGDDDTAGCLRRPPIPQLRPWVTELWTQRSTGDKAIRHEHVLPTGAMHVVIRLHAPPLRVFACRNEGGRVLGHAVAGAARAGYYVREIGAVADSVGAVLRPGAASVLLGVPADALAAGHVPLDAVWGRVADSLRERLLDVDDPGQRLDLFEAALSGRLREAVELPAPVAAALRNLGPGTRIDQLVADSGCSHRHFNALFRAAVGLNPKAYARVLRFQQLLAGLRSAEPRSWAELAAACGYADQAHLVREFSALAGMSPQTYRRRDPQHAHHVPIDA